MIVVTFVSALNLSAQYRNSYTELYDSERVMSFKESVSYISAVDKEGRKAGSEGEKAVAAYLHSILLDAGVEMLTPPEGSSFGIAKSGQDTLTSRNVYGFIQGYDPALRDRYIVIGARMDNLGSDVVNVNGVNYNRVYPGANGNASGLAMMTELAKMISVNSILFRRSIIFVGFGASCESFAGAWYFVNREFKDVDRIDAMINLDMLGTGYNGFYAYSGSNHDLNSILTKVSGDLQPAIPELVAAEPYPSDHRAFYDKEIPAMYFTTGKYPQHNTFRDTDAILDYDMMERELEFIYNFTLALANTGRDISFQNLPDQEAIKVSSETVAYFECDTRPMFQNSPDIAQFMKLWVYQYLKYPKYAVENGIQGTVYVNFIVGKDGKVKDAQVVKGIAEVLDKEALRIVEASPKWRPGRVDGVKVNTSITIPVEFRLEKKGSKGGFGINGIKLNKHKK